MAREYLRVMAVFHENGSILPVSFKLPDGREFAVERVSDRRPAPSLKAGGQGMRYTCTVLGKRIYLFLDENKWFMEMP